MADSTVASSSMLSLLSFPVKTNGDLYSWLTEDQMFLPISNPLPAVTELLLLGDPDALELADLFAVHE